MNPQQQLVNNLNTMLMVNGISKVFLAIPTKNNNLTSIKKTESRKGAKATHCAPVHCNIS